MIVFLLFFLVGGVPVSGETLPYWFIPLREAVYEQELSANEIVSIHREVSRRAAESLSGAAQYVMLSRSEYMIGRAYQYEERNNEAAAHYEEGIRFAEKALEIQASAEAWQMLAENISQSCAVRSVAYAVANGPKVERFAKNALAINSRNAAAQFMIAARWVYAPSPFNNFRRGIEMMSVIPNQSNMEKDDMFNVYLAIGYAYIQQRRFSQAKPWLLKSLEIYPTNKFAGSLLAKHTENFF